MVASTRRATRALNNSSIEEATQKKKTPQSSKEKRPHTETAVGDAPTSKNEKNQKKKKRKLSPVPPGIKSSAEHVSVADTSSAEKGYWLMKAEPESRIEKGKDVKFSIDDLAAVTEPEPWDGVRNYVARNNMRAMKKGELALFYHSNCKIPGVVGIMQIVEEASPDESAQDPKHPYYDAASSPENPKWSKVKVAFVRKFSRIIPLPELKSHMNGPLANMQTLKTSRLSVSRVTAAEWDFIEKLEKEGKQ